MNASEQSRFNLVIENLLISTLTPVQQRAVALTFQSRNRESSNFNQNWNRLGIRSSQAEFQSRNRESSNFNRRTITVSHQWTQVSIS